MSERLDKAGSQLFARTVDKLSAGCVRYPGVGNYIVGSKMPGWAVEPVHWQRSTTPRHRLPSDIWCPFEGDPRSGRLPRSYRSIGAMSISGEILEMERLGEGRMVAAWTIGDNIMVGRLPGKRTFSRLDGDPSRVAVALRIGKGPLEATIGAFNEADGSFTPLSGDMDIQVHKVDQYLPGIPVL